MDGKEKSLLKRKLGRDQTAYRGSGQSMLGLEFAHLGINCDCGR